MAPTNHALYLPSAKSPTQEVCEAPYNTPGDNEVVIRTQAVAINPADWKLQRTGMLLTDYPVILGCDVAGTVYEVGANLTSKFAVGNRVFGAANVLWGNKYSGFQEYPVLKYPLIAKVPQNVALSDAVVLPLGVNTAARCLFAEQTLGLELPGSGGSKGKTLIIWGASSSIGACGVQLATAAGYEVVGVASGKNHGLVKTLGAVQCFDHNDADVVSKMVEGLKGKEIIGAYDAISEEKTCHALCDVLIGSGGSKLISSVSPWGESYAKDGVVIKTNFAAKIEDSGVGHAVWQDFLEPAIATGTFYCKPDAEIVGHGLEQVQQAIDQLADGVSAKKLVVTL